jgi:hypothetical protein
MDDTPASGNKQRWDNYVVKWQWDINGGFKQARLFGDVTMEYIHTIETKTGKFYPEFCHGWDVDNFKFFADREDRCPACAAGIKGQHRYYMNAIDIEVEENMPKQPKADWTPVRLMDISPTLFGRLKELKTVNKGNAVSDAAHGAIVQVKFNKDADPNNMYSASMDTKDVALTEEQKNYIVVQKYPDGSTKIVKGKNGLPAQYEYIRCLNSRDDMVKSLRRNGYYGENDNSAAAAHSFDTTGLSREERVARVDAEAPVEEDIDMSTVFAGDDIVPAVAAPIAPVATPKKSNEPPDDCPTEFGKFANTLICHTECGVAKPCRQATNNKTAAEPSVSAPATPKKKEVAPIDDDDDTV